MVDSPATANPAALDLCFNPAHGRIPHEHHEECRKRIRELEAELVDEKRRLDAEHRLWQSERARAEKAEARVKELEAVIEALRKYGEEMRENYLRVREASQ